MTPDKTLQETMDDMQSITQEAERMSLLRQFGVRNDSDVIAWADSLIAQMDALPDVLLELSMTAPYKTADIISCLNRLRSGSDFWPAFRSTLPLIREFLVSHPERAECVANHLFLACCRFSYSDVPEDLHFVYQFDDAFESASDGIFGNRRKVYRAFIDELGKFA
jgi:hypothetical protein